MNTKTQTQTNDVTELQARVAQLETALASLKPKSRASAREMTHQDAFDCKFGKHAGLKTKQAAEAAGLSYGQVYSARGGYTFKDVTLTWTPKGTAATAPAEAASAS